MIRTSEYVSIGHPDKTADMISEYILDKYLEFDPNVRYGVEVQIKDNYVTIGGEVSSKIGFDDNTITKFVQDAVNKIGYNSTYQGKWGKENCICGNDLIVVNHISQQSADIAVGVDSNGWGDQGIFFGYAENNPYTNYMPLDHFLAKDLCQKLYYNAKENGVGGLDIKTQITLSDNEIYKVIVAIPCRDGEEYQKVKSFVIEWLNTENVDTEKFIEEKRLIINGTGIYLKHGSLADCGTTGRKLVVDFYGGNSKIGGGSPWTKDVSKADLTLNMLARDIAKNKLLILDKEIKALDRVTVFRVETSISCCIGKETIHVCNRWFSENGSLLGSEEFETRENIESLSNKYGLKKPNFCQLCEKGLLTNI